MEVLLEVVAEREVEERAPVRGQLHRGRQATLDDCQVADGEVPVEVVDVGSNLEAVVLRQALGVDPRAGDDDHPQVGDALLRLGVRVDDAAQQVSSHARPADGHDADTLVIAVAELPAVTELARIEAGDVAGEVVVLLRPVADQRQVGTEGIGDDVVLDCPRRPPGRADAGTARCARSSPRCSRRSRTPRDRRRPGIGSQPTKSVSHTYAARFCSGFSCR